MVGASLGFLWYNSPPAEVFMGDVGSLAIGGALGTVAILTKAGVPSPVYRRRVHPGSSVSDGPGFVFQIYKTWRRRRKTHFPSGPASSPFPTIGLEGAEDSFQVCDRCDPIGVVESIDVETALDAN
jgi:hypothetical protein